MPTRVPKTEITGLTGAVIKRVSRRMFGDVPDGLGVLWHHQGVLRTSMRLGAKVQRWHAVDQDLKTFAHIAVASQVGCGACLDFGYFQAENEGLDLVKARAVPVWRAAELFTALERDVLEYAEAMTTTPPTVTDELSARLLDRLGPAGMVELTTSIAFNNFAARSNVALGIEGQGFSQTCALPGGPARVAVAQPA